MDKTPTPNKNDKYDILRAHHRTDGSFKSVEELEMEYVHLTDELIHKMTHGEEVTINGERVRVKPDKVIFLDKSARPLAWLVRDLWDTLAPDPGSDDIPERPDFKFLNIDREQWRGEMDPNGINLLDANKVAEEKITGLRAIFGRHSDGSPDASNEMDGKVIMIVDEVRSTGDTLQIAELLVKRAFPTSHVFGTHWMSGMFSLPGKGIGNADVPVWYRDDSTDIKLTPGRGVGNRLPDGVITDPRQFFLSTRLPERDERALRLREDFKKLATDVVSSEVVYAPSKSRDDEDDRTRAISGLPYKRVLTVRSAIRERDALVPYEPVKEHRLKPRS